MESVQQFQTHTDDQIKNSIPNGPLEDRSCKDICCLVFFIILTLAFVILGIYFISKADMNTISTIAAQSSTKKHMFSRAYHQETKEIEVQQIKKCLVYVIGMVALAIILSIVYVVLLSKFPSCVVYSMMIIVTLMLIALAILMFATQAIVGGIVIVTFLLIWLCVMYCLKDSLKIGIKLLKITGTFLMNKCSVFFVPVVTSLFGLVFVCFWLWSLMGIAVILMSDNPQQFKANSLSNKQSNQTSTGGNILVTFWCLLSTFYTLFINYIMVFLIATAASFWYYQKDDSYWLKGLKWIFGAHIGSLTFAALLITILKFFRQNAQSQSRNSTNPCAQICMCLVACCLKIIQELLKVLNNNAVIVMSITGEGYVDSAKTAIGLIFKDFPLFYISQSIGSLVSFGGILLIVVLPTVLGYFLMKNTMAVSGLGEGVAAIAVGVLAIIFTSTFTQALSSIFIIYCLDKRYQAMNMPICKNISRDIRDVLQEIKRESGSNEPFRQSANQPNNGQPNYNRPSQQNYGQPNYGQNPYGQPPYGQPPYGQPPNNRY